MKAEAIDCIERWLFACCIMRLA